MSRELATILVGALVLAGCSGSGSTVVLDNGQSETGTLEVVGDTGAPEDVTGPEEVLDLGPGPDERGPDQVTEPDSGPACAPGEGCFLDPCEDHEECLSNWCVQHLGDKVCTITCQAECPPGWSCNQVAGTAPDLVFVCVSEHANLCKPCAAGADCKGVGGAEDVCVDYGDEGSFCGGACATDDDCPWGFACAEAVTVSGVGTWQCVAEAGVCPCTDTSVALALATPCAVSNEFGTCTGQRLCTDEGLSDCDAAVPAQELCNGLDDDCDGDVDEPAEVGGNYVNLCDDDNPCTADTCNGEAGCVNEILDGDECVDGNPCTVADHCVAGECTGTPVDCDDGNPCTDDFCNEEGGCYFENNSADCDDLDPCTVADECNGGACAGTPINCACQADEDCADLEDGDLCNGTLVCNVESLPYLCVVDPETVVGCPDPTGPDAACQAAACDPESGACSMAPKNEGLACDDGDPCTIGDACQDGACVAGVPLACNDGNPCTTDGCDPATGCVFAPVEGDVVACDDGNECTLEDQCVGALCKGTVTLDCDDGNPCTTDSCSANSGCVHQLNEAPCNDGDLCTVNDHCHLGECIGGGALNCNDSNVCTTDGCAAETGCTYAPVAGACDDYNACTEGDACSGGKCLPGMPVVCADDNECTDDLCLPASGCAFVNNQNPCDDGELCTVGDLCLEGECVGGELLDCDDGNPCTDDLCDGISGCTHSFNTAACDDGNACTGNDVCWDGTCAGTPLDCDDGDLCTDDGCDPATGCTHAHNTEPCDDGDACTVDDACANGLCSGGGDLVCDDGDDCTDDSCESETGCVHAPIAPCCGNGQVEAGEECDDGNDVDNDACDNSCQVSSLLFLGYATWTQNCPSQTDQQQDDLMDAACASQYGNNARAATNPELIGGLIIGLPGSNTSGDHLILKCPYCEGSNSYNGASGHARACIDPGASWPNALYPQGSWNPNCCTSSRTTICVP